MCGIAGFISLQEAAEQRTEAVQRMCAAMVHRGPDGEGIASSHEATLGMRRLAIFDPAHGHQPMMTADGRYTLVFNGAIYNFRELRTDLAQLGHKFHTECDTEVLLQAFAAWGEKCLGRLRGMFAFAVWDDQLRTLFAARDALGIKPFYYARLAHGGLLFGSELNALMAADRIPREIDPVSVGEYLAWFSVPAPRTIYRGIANLPPGQCLTFDISGRLKTKPWWHFATAPRTHEVAGSYQEFVAGLQAQLQDTIRAHQLADVPVGAFLSGGMDSTAVAGLMVRNGVNRLRTFSIVFNEAEFSEQSTAQETARLLGTEHYEELITGARLASDLPRILGYFDQPTGDGINTYYASQAARQGGVTVALSGLGGDELFGGYPSFSDLPRLKRWLPRWRMLPERLRGKIIKALHTRASVRSLKLADFLTHARDLHELAALRRRVMPEAGRLSLLAPDARFLAQRLGPSHPMLEDFAFELSGADDFQVISAWELRTYMADVLLRDSDVFSMAHSLELRVPLVDRVLLEWLWVQPTKFKYHPSLPKHALADAAGDVISANIRQRRKQGFTLPFALWMRGPLQSFLEDTFSVSALRASPWLDARAVRQVWQDFKQEGESRSWSRVWSLAVLVDFARRQALT
jgi:asparagine synthase (glutamine-hydrolysing)